VARRKRRILPPIFFVAGLFLFGLALLSLGDQAQEQKPKTMHPSSLTTTNGTSVLVYPVSYFGHRTEYIEVSYTFPAAAGDAYFLGCLDVVQARGGRDPADPMMAFTQLREASFVVSSQTLPPLHPFFSIDQANNPPCDPAVVFRWKSDGDAATNRPTVTILYHASRLTGDGFMFLAMLMGGGALLALLGGVSWIRARSDTLVGPPAGDSTVEALRSSLDQVLLQLERTRRTLLLAGILGVFLWYPFLVPWSWQQAARASESVVIPWGVATLTVGFLGTLTFLWGREFMRLDRQLAVWRGRLDELRARETHLMETLESGA